MDLGLAGAAVCISGGTKGLGRQAALAFAREGARIVVSARGAGGLVETVERLREAGAPDAFGVEVNILDPESIVGLFTQIETRWGELNTLINVAAVAGPSEGSNFAEVPDAQWQVYFEGGIMSAIRCTRAAVPLMRKAGWGRVVNISSISSRLGIPPEAPYMSAKAGLNAVSKNMAWVLAKENILVNTVTPGVFRTEGLAEYMHGVGVTPKYDPDSLVDCWKFTKEWGSDRYCGAIGRVARPEELSPLLLLLGSPANSYIVGANIPVDGGTDFSGG
jgi:NAD(P)-dependent dehydrogenase (short-subunit alcohol dehydrogenase family)